MTITRSPKTIVVYDITGLDYTVPFEYLARKFVVVTLIGELGRLVLTLNTDYRFTTPTQISLNTQPEAGYTTIEIRRVTSATDRLVDFHDGSILRSRDLNISSIQTLHVAEEARDLTSDTLGVNDDGNLDARGRKIVNLGKGTDDADAVNVGQLREFDTSTANNADRAEAAANRADTDAANALASANNAKTSETNAKVSERNAAGSASTANTAAMDARKSAEAAKDSEEIVVPLVPTVEQAAKDAAQAAQDAAQAVEDVKSLGAVPIGTIVMFAKEPPAGYLKLDGQSYSKTEYPDFFAYWGSEQLPDWSDKTPKMIGADLTLLQEKGWCIPSHTHSRGTQEIVGRYGTNNPDTTLAPWTSNFTYMGAFYEGSADITHNARYAAMTTEAIYNGVNFMSFEASRGWTGTSSEPEGLQDGQVCSSNEVDRVGIIYAIKVAGKVSDEGLMEVTQIKADLKAAQDELAAMKTVHVVQVDILGEVGVGYFTRMGNMVTFKWISNQVKAPSSAALLTNIPKGFQPVDSCVGTETATNRVSDASLSTTIVTCVAEKERIIMYNANNNITDYYRVSMVWFTTDVI